MRLFFTTLILFIYNVFIVAQENPDLNKIWVANDLKCFDLRFQNEVYFDYGLWQYGTFELISTDTVFYLVGERQSGYFEHNGRKESISFRIVRLTKDTLIIHPLNINSKALLEVDYKNHSLKYKYGDTVVIHESDKYLFLSKERVYDKNFEFDKIYFSTQGHFIQGLYMNIEINKKGEILFHGILNTGEYKGKYSGRLSRKELKALNKILKYSAVDLMPEKLQILFDTGPNYAMIISYNGTIKKIKRGTIFPYFNKPLLEFLLNIYTDVKLKRNENIEFTLPNST